MKKWIFGKTISFLMIVGSVASFYGAVGSSTIVGDIEQPLIQEEQCPVCLEFKKPEAFETLHMAKTGSSDAEGKPILIMHQVCTECAPFIRGERVPKCPLCRENLVCRDVEYLLSDFAFPIRTLGREEMLEINRILFREWEADEGIQPGYIMSVEELRDRYNEANAMTRHTNPVDMIRRGLKKKDQLRAIIGLAEEGEYGRGMLDAPRIRSLQEMIPNLLREVGRMEDMVQAVLLFRYAEALLRNNPIQ